MAKLKIYRGLPGSGKSTRAKVENPGWLHFEPDHLLTDTFGSYIYSDELHYRAKHLAQMLVDHSLAKGRDVAYSEVLCNLVDLIPLIQLAHFHDAEIEIIDCIGHYRSVHGVPMWVVDEMRSEFDYNVNPKVEKYLEKLESPTDMH